jgi:hypothetical protein
MRWWIPPVCRQSFLFKPLFTLIWALLSITCWVAKVQQKHILDNHPPKPYTA